MWYSSQNYTASAEIPSAKQPSDSAKITKLFFSNDGGVMAEFDDGGIEFIAQLDGKGGVKIFDRFIGREGAEDWAQEILEKEPIYNLDEDDAAAFDSLRGDSS